MQEQLSEARSRGSAAEATARDLQTQLTEAQERYVTQLAELDRTYEYEIAVFRDSVQDMASTPEGEAALRQYNAGERVQALAVLDQLNDALDRALQVGANIKMAARRRQTATLALDAREKGDIDTNSVIARFEKVTELDPDVHRDWIELARLYRDAGRLARARSAAERAALIARSDYELATALDDLGDVLVDQGDLEDALSRYQESFEKLRLLAEADPARLSCSAMSA